LCPNKESWAIEFEVQVRHTMMEAGEIRVEGTESRGVLAGELHDDLFKFVI
jgi:hypothetical protein